MVAHHHDVPGGIHYWWPKIFGKLNHDGMAQGFRRRDLRRVQP